MHNYVVFGASSNPLRHSNKAVKSLLRHNHKVIPIGFREGIIAGVPIQTGQPELKNIGAILLYVGPQRQPEYYSYLLKLKPEKIVFNPGTENPELQRLAEETGVDVIFGCALVMINAGQL